MRKQSSAALAFFDYLREHGMNVCFSNPGTSEMPLLEAMGQGNEWNTILCLHENVATGAADGFARMGSGHCMVLLHLGPGVANGLTNIHNARRAGSKMLIVVGEIATTHQGKGSVLETNIELCAQWVDAAYFPIKSVSDMCGVLR